MTIARARSNVITYILVTTSILYRHKTGQFNKILILNEA